MRRHIAIALAVVVSAAAAPAPGYETIKTYYGVQKAWTFSPVQYHLAPGCDPRESNRTACLSALRNGFARWTRLTCSTLVFQEGSPSATINPDDGINTVGWLSSWPAEYGADTIAVTLPVANESTGEMIDADISFNPGTLLSTDSSPDTIDVEAVATHEIGHVLGLDHSANPDATMYYSIAPNELFRRSLHDDDIRGACSIYPSGSAIPPECQFDSDCAPAETCSGGACSGGTGPGSRVYGQPCDTNNRCDPRYVCLGLDATNSACSSTCSLTGMNTCPGGDLCVELTSGGGACLPGSAPTPDALGVQCLASSDCLSRQCLLSPNGGMKQCTQSCDPRRAWTCPADFYCAFGTSGNHCFPGGPPATLGASGAPCARDDGCASNLCLPSSRDPSRRACAQVCTADHACPFPTHCVGTDGPEGLCQLGELGDGFLCASSRECAAGPCVTDAVDPSVTYCSEPCGACPDGWSCGEVAPFQEACVATVPPGPGAKRMGEACGQGGECASALCGPDGVCTHPCPEGACEEGFACAPAPSGEMLCLKAPTSGCEGCGTGNAQVSGLLAIGLVAARRRRARPSQRDRDRPSPEPVARSSD